jgi:hypothetical protein
MFRAGSRGSLNRGSTEDVGDDDESGRAPFELNLGEDIKLVYDDGKWTPGTAQRTRLDNQRLTLCVVVKLPADAGEVDVRQLMQENRKLKEENNLLKYKLEVVVDMVGELRRL